MIARQIEQHPNIVNDFKLGIQQNNLENTATYNIWHEV